MKGRAYRFWYFWLQLLCISIASANRRFFLSCFIIEPSLLLHISDLHYKTTISPGYASLLFLNSTVFKSISLSGVIVSGDMTLGYNTRFLSSTRLDLWKSYYSIWSNQESELQRHWFDVPGNHDYAMNEGGKKGYNMNVFSARGSESPFYVIPFQRTAEGTFCLLGIDETYDPSTNGMEWKVNV